MDDSVTKNRKNRTVFFLPSLEWLGSIFFPLSLSASLTLCHSAKMVLAALSPFEQWREGEARGSLQPRSQGFHFWGQILSSLTQAGQRGCRSGGHACEAPARGSDSVGRGVTTTRGLSSVFLRGDPRRSRWEVKEVKCQMSENIPDLIIKPCSRGRPFDRSLPSVPAKGY